MVDGRVGGGPSAGSGGAGVNCLYCAAGIDHPPESEAEQAPTIRLELEGKFFEEALGVETKGMVRERRWDAIREAQVDHPRRLRVLDAMGEAMNKATRTQTRGAQGALFKGKS